MKLCSYVMTSDTGFAPNPFWGYCTLANCTPNHRNAQLSKGDWILGNSTKQDGHRLIFLMEITEEKKFYDDYFNDPRFKHKKPIKNGSYEERVGDNIYFMNKKGSWTQCDALFHNSIDDKTNDLRNPYVFISEHFFYFGSKRFDFGNEFCDLIKHGRGMKYCYEEKIINKLIRKLNEKYSTGINGVPANKDTSCPITISTFKKKC